MLPETATTVSRMTEKHQLLLTPAGVGVFFRSVFLRQEQEQEQE